MISWIAKLYLKSPSQTFRPLLSFQNWIMEQYNKIPTTIDFVDYEPYPDVWSMKSEMESTGRMKITTLHNKSIFDPIVNLYFRAVHDFDHILGGCNFNNEGEKQACRMLLNRCRDPEAQALLFSEIYGQACVQHTTGKFANQKFVKFPKSIQTKALSYSPTIEPARAWWEGKK